MPRPAAFARPLLIAAAAMAMLAWTWDTWPDPLVDFGTHLYVPWRLSVGDVLYRDVALYNGPLSSYANALVFRLFGVGMNRLETANAIVLAIAMVLAYRLALRASGPRAALFGGLTFALVFAFGQGVGIGNYNWITPYAHELTHGVTLGLAAVACLDRYFRTGRLRWAAAAGAAVGAAFLTKAEPAVAAVAAVGVQLVAGLWVDRRRAIAVVGVTIGSALAVPVVAAALLSIAMPLPIAVRGVLGSWPWALDRRVTSLAFYRGLSGLDDVAGNLRTMVEWAGAYAGVGVVVVAIACTRPLKRAGRVIPVVIAIVLTVGVVYGIHSMNWPDALVALPVLLCGAGILAAIPILRRSEALPGRLALRLSLVAFSLALLGKILLRVHAFHYGFALAMPGTLVLVAIVAEELPARVDRRGGRGSVVRAVGMPVWVGFVLATLVIEGQLLSFKRSTIMAEGPDQFRGSTRGEEVEATIRWIDRHVPAVGTVAVYPQGLMMNYLARRATPTRFVNFMPPEVIAAGEDVMLAALAAHPPDAVVIDGSAYRNGQFTLDRQYDWGRATADWIRDHYRVAERVTPKPPAPPLYGFVILVRK